VSGLQPVCRRVHSSPVSWVAISHRKSDVLCLQLMFEKHRPPAVFMAKNAVLSSFATGRQTSVVVDIGHEGTTGAARHTVRRHLLTAAPCLLAAFADSALHAWLTRCPVWMSVAENISVLDELLPGALHWVVRLIHDRSALLLVSCRLTHVDWLLPARPTMTIVRT